MVVVPAAIARTRSSTTRSIPLLDNAAMRSASIGKRERSCWGGDVVPDGKDHFGAVDFAGGEAVQSPLGPLLVEKVRADHDDAEPGAGKAVVDGPAQAVADGERELVEPDREAPRAKGSGEWADEIFLVLTGVADEDVPVPGRGWWRGLLGCFVLRDELPDDVARLVFEDVRDFADAIDALVERAESGIGPALPRFRLAILPPPVNRQGQSGLGVAGACNGYPPDRDFAGSGVGELFVAPCEHAVEVDDLLFVGRRRAAVIEGAVVPGHELVAKPAIGILQGFVVGATEAEIAVARVVELVAKVHDGDGVAGGTMCFRAVGA